MWSDKNSTMGMQLKIQEALRKKEKFQREHEEVSGDATGCPFGVSFVLFLSFFFI